MIMFHNIRLHSTNRLALTLLLALEKQAAICELPQGSLQE